MKDIETIKISYDNTNAEVEQAYKRFLHKYTFKRSVIFSIVYLIAAGLGLNLMITAPSQIYGYLVFVIGLGMLFSVWARPYYARKKLIRTLESFSRETYTAEFRKESIEIQTIILPDEETEGEYFTGHAPNYVKVYASGENLHNQIRTVKVTDIYRDGVSGIII